MEKVLKSISNRSYVVAGSMLLFAGFVLFKLFTIQLVDGAKYRKIAQNLVFKNFVIPANRGNLYDSNYNLLATSVPKYDIRFDTFTVKNEVFQKEIQNLSVALSKELGRPASYYNNLLRKERINKNRYLLICRNIGYAKYTRIKNFPIFKLGANRGGLIVEQRTIREHPIGKIAERTVGYDRKDKDGHYVRVGLEGAYGSYLRGKEGRSLKQKIAKGQWKSVLDNNEIEPKDGYDVVSTIDVNIQDIAHHALLGQLEKFEAEHGSVVVMESKTGEIKAISNLGRTKRGKYYEKINYAVGEPHEPGSTFKLMSMIALLEDKAIDSSYVVDTEKGRVKFYDRTVTDSHRGGYGKISAARAFEVSSNTAFAKMINEQYKSNPKKLLNRFYNMGLNKTLGIDIVGEGKPKLPYPGSKDWYGTTLPWMAFGYGVSMTALQTLTFYNAVANDGVVIKPKFIKEVRTWDQVEKKFNTEIINSSFCSKKTAKIMQAMLRNVVLKGTATNLRSDYVAMAGKTGTCQVEYWIKPGQYISSFAGYFPAENPKYSCIVVIHKPKKEIGYYGSTVAAPVFKKIALKIYSGTPVTDEIKLVDTPGKNSIKTYENYFKLSRGSKETMPNVIGMQLMDVLPLLENLGLRVKVAGEGKVIQQSINAGDQIGKSTTVNIILS